MAGAVVMVVALVVVIPVVVVMSSTVIAALLGYSMTKTGETLHEGSELIELNR